MDGLVRPFKSTPENEIRRSLSQPYWILFLLLWSCYSFVHQRHFDIPTAVSRLDLLHSLVVYNSFKIDSYHENTPDKALYDGHYYSDKAPGTVVVALTAFVISDSLLALIDISLDSKSGWLISSWIACAGSLGIITALGGVALFAWLSRRVAPRWALITTLAVYLGAAPFPYATMLFSHALVIGLLSIALWALDFPEPKEPRGQLKRDLLAGFCCGWALASEFTAGLVILSLALFVFLDHPRRGFRFLAAMAVPMLLVPAYSWICFETAFTIGYSHQASFPQMQRGLFGIVWPDPEIAYRHLFSPTRGLFFWTPFLIMAGFGYAALCRDSMRWFWLCYLVPVIQVLVISGYTWDWQAGPTLGPRYLSPMLPLLALPAALGLQKVPWLGVPLAGASILLTGTATVIDATPRGQIYNPLLDFHLPKLMKGEFGYTWASMAGLPAVTGPIILAVVILLGTVWLLRQLRNGSDLQRNETK